MHTALLLSLNHKVTDKIQESLHSNKYYHKKTEQNQKNKRLGKKLGTKFIWDISLISRTVVTNMGWSPQPSYVLCDKKAEADQ